MVADSDDDEPKSPYLPTEFDQNEPRISVAKALKQGAATFSADGNAGLVAQAAKVFLERKALALPSLYLNLPLNQFAEKLKLENTHAARSLCEKLALAHPELVIRIDVRAQLVHFGSDTENRSSPKEEAIKSQRLLNELHKISQIGQALHLLSDHISAHPLFIAKQNAQKVANTGGTTTPGSISNDPASVAVSMGADAPMMDDDRLVPIEFS